MHKNPITKIIGITGDKMSKKDTILLIEFLKINLNGGEILCNLRN